MPPSRQISANPVTAAVELITENSHHRIDFNVCKLLWKWPADSVLHESTLWRKDCSYLGIRGFTTRLDGGFHGIFQVKPLLAAQPQFCALRIQIGYKDVWTKDVFFTMEAEAPSELHAQFAEILRRLEKEHSELEGAADAGDPTDAKWLLDVLAGSGKSKAAELIDNQRTQLAQHHVV
ncbi:MAG: hypothetical protein Q9201_006559 [Fulgogasparrea decipioides]